MYLMRGIFGTCYGSADKRPASIVASFILMLIDGKYLIDNGTHTFLSVTLFGVGACVCTFVN